MSLMLDVFIGQSHITRGRVVLAGMYGDYTSRETRLSVLP